MPCLPTEFLCRAGDRLEHFECHHGRKPDEELEEKPIPEASQEPSGLGDYVKEALDRTVVPMLHAVGIDLSRCGGCEDRRLWLNRIHASLRRVGRKVPSDTRASTLGRDVRN